MVPLRIAPRSGWLIERRTGQRPDAVDIVDIADRPQTFARAHVIVHLDPAGVSLHAHRLEADTLDARAPAGSHEQLVAAHVRAVVELQDIVLALAPRSGGAHPEHQLDSATGVGARASSVKSDRTSRPRRDADPAPPSPDRDPTPAPFAPAPTAVSTSSPSGR